LEIPQNWKCSRSDWMGLWETWCSGKCTCPWKGVELDALQIFLPTQTILWCYDKKRAALKVMPPILLCLPTTTEADVGGMAVEVKPSHQYINIPLHIVAKWQVAAEGHWKNGVWHGSVYEAKVWNWIIPCRKTATHWLSSVLAECLWIPNSRCEHREMVYSTFQQRNSNSESPPLVQIFMSMACVVLFIADKNRQLMVVSALKNSVLSLRTSLHCFPWCLPLVCVPLMNLNDHFPRAVLAILGWCSSDRNPAM